MPYMKRYLYYIINFIALFACTCFHTYAQVSFVSQDGDNITVRTIGLGKKIAEATGIAEQNAFYIIFYRGIPGSAIKDKLIDKPEDEAQRMNKDYFDAFFNNRYHTFITSVVQNGKPMKEKHHKISASLDVTINVNALRKDLEENHVIRKFGY
jgi:hypothetical protein